LGLATLADERDQPRDVGYEGTRARAVGEVVPHPGARGPGESDHRRLAHEEMRPAAHQYHHLVKGGAESGHVDHHGAVGRGFELVVDGRDKLALRFASRRPENAELLDIQDARRAGQLRAARAIGFREIVEGPFWLAELHLRDAGTDRVARAARLPL